MVWTISLKEWLRKKKRILDCFSCKCARLFSKINSLAREIKEARSHVFHGSRSSKQKLKKDNYNKNNQGRKFSWLKLRYNKSGNSIIYF